MGLLQIEIMMGIETTFLNIYVHIVLLYKMNLKTRTNISNKKGFKIYIINNTSMFFKSNITDIYTGFKKTPDNTVQTFFPYISLNI